MRSSYKVATVAYPAAEYMTVHNYYTPYIEWIIDKWIADLFMINMMCHLAFHYECLWITIGSNVECAILIPLDFTVSVSQTLIP